MSWRAGAAAGRDRGHGSPPGRTSTRNPETPKPRNRETAKQRNSETAKQRNSETAKHQRTTVSEKRARPMTQTTGTKCDPRSATDSVPGSGQCLAELGRQGLVSGLEFLPPRLGVAPLPPGD